MKQKNLIILFIILAVLLGLVFAKNTMKPEVPRTEEVADIIAPQVGIEDLKAIVLELKDVDDDDETTEKEADEVEDGDKDQEEGKKNEVRLIKVDGQWTVETQFGVLANEKTLTSALERIDDLKGELRSNRAGILGDFGIRDDEAFHIRLTRTDNQNVHILVGTKKAGVVNNFVRLAGSNEVYLVEENLLAAFGIRGEDEDQTLNTTKWADKRLTHMDANEVVGITVTAGQTKAVDLKKETVDDVKKWQSAIPYEFNLNATKIKKIAENFNNTYARDVIAPDKQDVFNTPGWIGTFTLSDDSTIQVMRGAKDDSGNNYYVKVEGVPYHFLVPKSTFDSREKQQGNIFGSNPLKADEKRVQAFSIEDLVNDKQFTATKQPPAETETASEEGAEDETAQQEDAWVSPDGETLDLSKVRDILSKIKTFNVEAALPPKASLANTMNLSISKDDGVKTYTISKDMKLDNGKECHMLKVGGSEQNYCVAKSYITALQNALP